jgi:hypothetical protein
MSALPNPAGLKYFDNSNSTPAPYGVSVPFNQEDQDVWIGYDVATSQVCITNFNRTTTLVCFTAGGVSPSVDGQIKTFLVPLDYTMFNSDFFTPGAGYNDGVFTGVTFTGGAGAGAIATLTISGGKITNAVFTNTGAGYGVGDILTPDNNSGSGITIGVGLPQGTVTIFSNTKKVAVGRLPLGYRYFGFIYRNDALWNNAGNVETQMNLIIIDTVSDQVIDIPMVGVTNLTNALPGQQVDGSASTGGPILGFTGNCFLDAEGLQGISVQIDAAGQPIELETLSKGEGTLYIIATKIPTNPEGLLPIS